MIPLIDDGSWTLKDLKRYREPVEIRTPDGQLVGTFVPASAEPEMTEAEQEADLAELERRARSQEPGYTMEQVRQIIGTEESARAFLAQTKPSGGDGCPTP